MDGREGRRREAVSMRVRSIRPRRETMRADEGRLFCSQKSRSESVVVTTRYATLRTKTASRALDRSAPRLAAFTDAASVCCAVLPLPQTRLLSRYSDVSSTTILNISYFYLDSYPSVHRPPSGRWERGRRRPTEQPISSGKVLVMDI